MVDLDTHRIIDLIPSRDTDDVGVWLKKFPNIEVISRDGAQIYAHAFQKAHPEVVQVSEQKNVDVAREHTKNIIPIEHIAKMLHHTYRTIQRYLDPGYSVVNGHYNVRIPNKLAPFEEKVIMLRSQGMTYPKIHEIISKEGYNGSVASLRMFMQKEQLRRINSNREDRLEEWLKKLEQFNITELQTYVNGVRKDLDTVKNGIKYEYNNGLAEGSINKIKVINRTMYGRNSFQLLKGAKVLLYEKFRLVSTKVGKNLWSVYLSCNLILIIYIRGSKW